MLLVNTRTNKAQAFSGDLMISLSIVILVALFYLIHLQPASSTDEGLLAKAQTISSLLMTQGYPLDWNNLTVSIPGIVNDFAINETKLGYLYSFEPNLVPLYFQTDRNVYIYLEQAGTTVVTNGYNASGRAPPSNALNIAQVQRVVLYQDQPAILKVVVWS